MQLCRACKGRVVRSLFKSRHSQFFSTRKTNIHSIDDKHAAHVTNPSPSDVNHPFVVMTNQYPSAFAQDIVKLAKHPFADSRITEFAVQEIKPVTLNELLKLGMEVKENPSRLVENARALQEELPKRLAKRVKAIEKLPYIMGINPWIKKVHQLYRDSFEQIVSFPPVNTREEEDAFTEMLSLLVQAHADTIPQLAKGFQECEKYLDHEEAEEWLSRMIKARISIRVLAEHHMALHHPDPHWLGIVNTKCDPVEVVKFAAHVVTEMCEANYGTSPEITIDGLEEGERSFAYIPVHLEYMLTELLKNSMRATVEFGRRNGKEYDHPPLAITVTMPPGKGIVTIRIRDQGGGIPYSLTKKAFVYSWTTVNDTEEDGSIFQSIAAEEMSRSTGGPMHGLGFGLPMTKLYAEYFGGQLGLESMYGYGTDVFLELKDVLVSEASDAVL
jgi:hypothetical protein